jgi:hypothetical protein
MSAFGTKRTCYRHPVRLGGKADIARTDRHVPLWEILAGDAPWTHALAVTAIEMEGLDRDRAVGLTFSATLIVR